MEKNLKDYFTTGEFARLCNVKKQTLFHYDDIGILSPEIVGENGYRYYSYTQLEVFSTISMLKDLDMPLADIKKYLDHRSPEAFIRLLERQQQEVDEKIKELQWLKRFIDTKLRITKEGLSVPINEIFLETRPEEYLIATEYLGDDVEKDIAAAVTEHLNFCHSLDIYSAYAIGGMIPISCIVPGESYIYSYFYTRTDQSGSDAVIVCPAGDFAVCCDNQGYGRVEEICARLLQYAADHGYRPGAHIYEDLLLDEMSAGGYDNYTVKLSLPLLRA
ncbi:MerR family transcriptional regulator [Anaerovorax odorimutans]|uniref:MerR family transcriptional regulator n=1 Tax=Anaerovorax odorimutans TaxID=109327 RepID=A0ABT1RM15_9FIRM|nr:MerR family transcriptional regulator [Anaerovorax odorimutans]MCQ4636223.1 MerR family transcriptional regulator [Anaerovorax odorimutans]